MNKIQHFVITRFNLKISQAYTKDKRGLSTQSTEWLDHRFDLFEHYCLPSLAAQTVKDFTWFIFFDAATPQIYRQRIESARKICPQIHPCFIEGIDIKAVMNEHIDKDTNILITTRIDNDDAFRDDALAVVRQQLDHATSDLCVNFRYGFSYNGQHAEVFSQKYNPFSSLIEYRKPEGFKTIFGEGHGKIHNLAKVRQLNTGPHWLMVVHDRNVVNRMSDDYRPYLTWKWRRLRRYIKKYLIYRIRRVFWPAEYRKKYVLNEINDRFHVSM